MPSGTGTAKRLGTRAAAAVAATAALLPALPASTADATDDAARGLIEAYSPITMLREQTDGICDKYEEQFQPQTVEAVLGNPRVKLQRYADGRTKTVVESAPTAADIAGKGDDYYLDLPGDPLQAGCTYAKSFAKLKRDGRAQPTTYAHIAREKGETGFVVQYWFFYYFNQFNDVHEGDWEGMQIAFDAATPTKALAEGPDKIALFQHGGGQVSDWDANEVEKEGTHPVVYPAAGSHATFHETAVFVENGQAGSGLGCDNTTEPVRRLVPTPVAVPTKPRAGTPFQWLTYEGHWGEREPGFNTGPTGPNTKTQWLEPFSWMDRQRLAAPRLPGGTVVGPAVTNAFCGTVAQISELVNFQQQSSAAKALLIAGGIALLALLAWLITRTRWSPLELSPLRTRRWFGQLIRAAGSLYGRHWRVLLPIGLTALPVLGGIELLSYAIGEIAGESHVGGFLGAAGAEAPVRDTINGLGQPIGYAVVGGAVISFIHLTELSKAAGIGASYRYTLPRLGRLVLANLAALALCALLALTIVGLPFAVKKYVDWQFITQEILFKDCRVRDSLRGSTEAVRGSWWWTVRVILFFWLIGVVTGPIMTLGLVFANLSLTAIDLIGSLVFSLLLPYVTVGRTLLYLDLQARGPSPAPAGRRIWWKPWRRAEPSPQPG